MWLIVIPALLLGLAGNLHCIGMCGPIALALPVHNRGLAYKIRALLGYHSGRILTYAVLGFLFGMLGKGLIIAGLQQYLSIISGILILLIVLFPAITSRFQHATILLKLKGSMQQFLAKKNAQALFVFGLMNGLLPCGLVYIALTASLATGHPWYASLFMFIFGLATIPGLFAVGFLSTAIKRNGSRTLKFVSPVFTIVVALVLILRGMNLGIPFLSPDLAAPMEKVSCCHR